MPAKIYSFKETAPPIAYVDSSFFLNVIIADSDYYEQCKEYVENLKDSKTILVSSALTLDEIYYTLLKVLAIRDHGKGWQTKLKKDKTLVENYTKIIEEQITNLLEIPNLFFVDVKSSAVINSMKLIRDHGIFPRDAIHAQIALMTTKNIISTDADFAKVDNINLYTCNKKLV